MHIAPAGLIRERVGRHQLKAQVARAAKSVNTGENEIVVYRHPTDTNASLVCELTHIANGNKVYPLIEYHQMCDGSLIPGLIHWPNTNKKFKKSFKFNRK